MTPTDNHKPASVSSNGTRQIVMSLNMFVKVILIILLVGLSFYGGYLYGNDNHVYNYNLNNVPIARKFAIGLVLYISPTSITISNEESSISQSFNITPHTTISINGTKAVASQITAGEMALIRINRTNSNQAGVIIVNTHFHG